MDLICRTLVVIAASTIAASALGPIIDVPPHYNPVSPWGQLAALDLKDLTETDCQRTCVVGGAPRVCLYTLVLEYYSAMGTACRNCSTGVLKDCFRSQCVPVDGYERGVMTINRMIPGPQIQVCKGDVLVINVINKMKGTGATLHWHGLAQTHSQWMDGVPYVTQCPIGGTNFTYVFSAEKAGTFFYHSHTGFHRTNGQYGVLIIREPRYDEPWPTGIYDSDLPEHTILIADWMHYPAEMFFPGLRTLKPGAVPASILVNGLGRYLNGSDDDRSFNVQSPLATFHVQRNRSYRFRIINANSLLCPVLIQIENHNMTLIATDGSPIVPTIVDGVVSAAGERYDVVINTDGNEPEQDSFWIHLRGLGICESILKVQQYAVLSYGTDVNRLGIIPGGRRPTIARPLPSRTIVNDPECAQNTKFGGRPKRLCISDLRVIGQQEDKDILIAEPDRRLFITVGFHQYTNASVFYRNGNYREFMSLGGDNIQAGVMSNITFVFPSTPSLFLRDAADPGFCSPDNLPADCRSAGDRSTSHCECSHVETVEEGDLVEMVLINDDIGPNPIDHPIHLHGYAFYVVQTAKNSSRSTRYTRGEIDGMIRKHTLLREVRNTVHVLPALKDTIVVPAQGFVVVRFRVRNPGDWLMHCHYEYHTEAGMMMILRVRGQISPKPPGFPTCRKFDPLHLGA